MNVRPFFFLEGYSLSAAGESSTKTSHFFIDQYCYILLSILAFLVLLKRYMSHLGPRSKTAFFRFIRGGGKTPPQIKTVWLRETI